ncbi:MAG TPA: hypothetical protein PLD88_15665, partial [Candidatus Berkiella sp.]|nr:hypothetical protein [Candidatus Berkiella sp.]
INLGEFGDQVPQEFANLLLENNEEKILKEETFDGKTYYYTENIKSYDEAVKTLERLKSKGFTGATLVAFHKFTEISVEKARQLLAN